MALGRSQAPLGSGAPTAAAGRAGLSPQRAEDRQGTCRCQQLPRVTEASEPRQDVRYHFIMTKATSHTILKVHYYSPSTNHRHKPGVVQIWPKWQKTLSRAQGWGERRGAGLRQVLGYKCCSRQTQTPPSPGRVSRTAGRTDRQPHLPRRQAGKGMAQGCASEGSAPGADPAPLCVRRPHGRDGAVPWEPRGPPKEQGKGPSAAHRCAVPLHKHSPPSVPLPPYGGEGLRPPG